MKASQAVAKLEKAGFSVVTNGTYYAAKNDSALVEFTATNGNVKANGFSYYSSTACAPSYGLKLAQVL
jgi:hypothetical protein